MPATPSYVDKFRALEPAGLLSLSAPPHLHPDYASIGRAMGNIPFNLPDIHYGMTEIKGAVYLEEVFLVLEVQTVLFGEFEQEYHVVKIEPRALRDVRLERGIFKDKLCLWPKENTLLNVVPGIHRVELKLKIWNKYRPEAERLVEQVRQLRLADQES
jgi:hypothetical protein